MIGVPMKVHPSHTGEVKAARADGHAATKLASKSSASAASFASVLAKQSDRTTAVATVPGTDVTVQAEAVKLRKGESMRAVNGHSYAEISGGPRDGMYVNTTNNKRRGQAFVLVHRNGREYHIYGSGKDRLVVALRKREPDHDTAKTTTPPNTVASTGGTTPTVSAS
jgi:hypothetical protein